MSKISLTEAPECTIYRPCLQNFKRAEYGLFKYIYVRWMKKYTATIDTNQECGRTAGARNKGGNSIGQLCISVIPH